MNAQSIENSKRRITVPAGTSVGSGIPNFRFVNVLMQEIGDINVVHSN